MECLFLIHSGDQGRDTIAALTITQIMIIINFRLPLPLPSFYKGKEYSRTLVLSYSRTLVLSYSRTLVLSYSRTLVLSYSRTLVLSYSRTLGGEGKNDKDKLNPWTISGLIDGEGCFTIKIRKNP